MVPRLQLTVSDELEELIKNEALRRIRDNEAGKRTGTVMRDIIVCCIKLSFKDVRRMTRDEINHILRQ